MGQLEHTTDTAESTAIEGKLPKLSREPFRPVPREVGSLEFTPAEALARKRGSAILSKALQIDPITAEVLVGRGFQTFHAIEKYSDRDLEAALQKRTPPLNLDRGAEILHAALLEKKRVAFCFDYDCDGATSSSQLIKTWQVLGQKENFRAIASDRFNGGYGLTKEMVDAAVKGGCQVLVALDIGSSNHEALQHAKENGLEVIVLDHHQMKPGDEVPASDAFINPAQEGCGYEEGELCTAGLAYLLVRDIKKRLESSGDKESAEKIDLDKMVQLAGLGTVADVMKLTGLNRILVRRGIQKMNETPDVWVLSFREVADYKGRIDASTLGFLAGPWINAAGRMLEDGIYVPGKEFTGVKEGKPKDPEEFEQLKTKLRKPNAISRKDLLALGEVNHSPGVMLAVKALTTRSNAWRRVFFKALAATNQERKDEQKAVRSECFDRLWEGCEKEGAVGAYVPDAHPGVRGPACSNIVEATHVPAIVLNDEGEGLVSGSARAPEGYHLARILNNCRDSLVKFGGHSGAGGVTLKKEQVQEFLSRFAEEAKKQRDANPEIRPEYLSPDVFIDLNDLRVDREGNHRGMRIAEETRSYLSPIGRGNEGAKLGIRNLFVADVRLTKDERHMVVTVHEGKLDSGRPVELRLWHQTDHPALEVGSWIDVIVEPEKRKMRYGQKGSEVTYRILAASPVPEQRGKGSGRAAA